jgi:predicted DNA-binding antitoxin AbrB/MazE fold protein
MGQMIEAIYTGGILQPTRAIEGIEEGSRLILTVTKMGVRKPLEVG